MLNRIILTKQSATCIVDEQSRSINATGSPAIRTIIREVDVWGYSVTDPSQPVKSYEDYLEECSTIVRFNDPRYNLLRPIEFDEKELVEGIAYLACTELGIYGSGKNLPEAQDDCVQMLIGLYEAFAVDTDNMSEEAAEFGERLKTYLTKTGAE